MKTNLILSGASLEIFTGMARAFFASAWADQCEEAGESSQLSGRDIMDCTPDEIDPAAIHAAETLVHQFLGGFSFHRVVDADEGLRLVYERAQLAFNPAEDIGADRDLTPELFGHYLAMQAMGSGVGLESFGASVRDAIPVPYVEFGSYSLERDYFEVDAK